MKKLNLRNVLLALILIFFMQNGSILLPDLPDGSYSEEELIAPCNDSTYSSAYND